MIRILCVTPSYWPAFQYGGPVFVNHYLNRALVKRGIDVTVYTTNVGLLKQVAINEETNVDGVRVFYFSISEPLEALGATGWQLSWKMTKALWGSIDQFDLVHINAVWNYPSAAAALMCKLRGVPYILSAHGALYPYTLHHKRWKKLPYYHLVAKWLIRAARAIHYTGADEAEKCHSPLKTKSRAMIVPYVLDFSDFIDMPDREALKNRYPQLKGRTTVLFLSRLNWKKGLDILVRAFALVVKKHPDVHLLIVGNDESGYEAQVKNWFTQCGLAYLARGADQSITDTDTVQSKVTFAGMLTGKDKAQAYAGSDIFVLPSYSENFGIVVVEAMICGVPVVVSDQVGIHKEVANFNAGLVTRTDPAEFAAAISMLIENPQVRAELGRNGRRLVRETFAADQVLDRMIEAYQTYKKAERTSE